MNKSKLTTLLLKHDTEISELKIATAQLMWLSRIGIAVGIAACTKYLMGAG